jgi:hypothetical protein
MNICVVVDEINYFFTSSVNSRNTIEVIKKGTGGGMQVIANGVHIFCKFVLCKRM